MKRLILSIFASLIFTIKGLSQQVPMEEENIPFLVTFGKDADKSWGDDDYSQTFFFVVPKFQVDPVYIRIFDPEVSEGYDERKGEFNSKTKFSIFGGKDAFTNKNAKFKDPGGKYKSGNLLASKIFISSDVYDDVWYTFGPFNPTEGEYINEYSGYLFKIIAEGLSGDDGNLYKYFLSSSPTSNKAVEGGNAFTYKYTFRISDNQNSIAHIYPYIEPNVYAIKISNFDFDNDGNIKIVSISKKEELSKASGDNIWAESNHKIGANEIKSTLDVQFIKNKNIHVKNNNVSLFVTNQDEKLLPLYTVPIGGLPLKNKKIIFKEKKKIVPY